MSNRGFFPIRITPPPHATEPILIPISNGVRSYFSFRRSRPLVLHDMSSAFDLVNHSVLIGGLSSLVVSYTAFSFPSSYLIVAHTGLNFNIPSLLNLPSLWYPPGLYSRTYSV